MLCAWRRSRALLARADPESAGPVRWVEKRRELGKLSRDEKNTRDVENRGPARPRKQPLDLSGGASSTTF